MSLTNGRIPTLIQPSVRPTRLSPAHVVRQFKQLVANGKVVIAGSARRDPEQLWTRGLLPKYKIELFDTAYYLTNVRQIPELRFYVAYVVQTVRGKPQIYPRIFYKDLSLAWRSASHFAYDDGDIWIGKGDVTESFEDGEEYLESIESTTDLPLEIQSALESLLSKTRNPKGDESLLGLILRQSSADRVEPFSDFTRPRALATANPANLIHRGKSIAKFRKLGNPSSLHVVSGFEPDFKNGVLEEFQQKSRLYGGRLKKYRILSINQKIQYQFFHGPKHVWLMPPQSLTTELSSYGVRTIDVHADDDLFIPGYEYHHYEDNGQLYSQIPAGYVGEVCPVDDVKADASPWLEAIPLIQEYRKWFV